MPGGIAVALDYKLSVLKRVWVVAEVNQAMTSRKKTVFRFCGGRSSVMDGGVKDALRCKSRIVPPVVLCEASHPNDKKMILGKIGGPDQYARFDAHVRSITELQFGSRHHINAESVRGLDVLEMDCSW